MYTLHFLDPSTTSSLEDAKRELESSRKRVKKLTDDIQEAEEKLARLVRESRCTIRLMENEKSELEQRVEHTLAYLSPLRRLPRELLQEIFLFNFEDYPCCAWVLSSVCSIWRRVALSMPRLWSKVCLFLLTFMSRTEEIILDSFGHIPGDTCGHRTSMA